MKKLTAVIMATLIMAMCLSGCTKTEAETATEATKVSDTVAESVVDKTTDTETTDATSAAVNEEPVESAKSPLSTKSTDKQDNADSESENEPDITTENEEKTEPVQTDEGDDDEDVFADIYTGDLTEEEVLELAAKGLEAMQNCDSKGIARYTDIGYIDYLSEGEWRSEEELAVMLEEALEEEVLSVSGVPLGRDVFGEVKELSEREVAEINFFAQSESENEDICKITRAYRIETTNSQTTATEETDEDMNLFPYVLVVEINGEWKTDIFLSFFCEMSKSFGSVQFDENGNPYFEPNEDIGNITFS